MQDEQAEVRRLTTDDREASWRLSMEAFGGPPDASLPEVAPGAYDGRHDWGAWEGGHLLGKVVAFEFGSWWWGQQIPTTGIAGVAVSAEARGRGLLSGLFASSLREAVERGEPLSTLFPTANGIYRRLGYELISSYDTVQIPTSALAGVRTVDRMTVRRARVDDVPALRELYGTWARSQNGPLTRTGPRFRTSDQELIDEFTAVTLAVDEHGGICGFASWDRGEGYDQAATLRVHDLLATSLDAYAALWRTAASFASVVGSVRLTTSGADPARLVLPTAAWDVVARHPYCLRILDLPSAVGALHREAPVVASRVTVEVTGDPLGLVDGTFDLIAGDGPVRCQHAAGHAADPLRITIQGLSLLYSGAQSCGNLRLLGCLSGPVEHDSVLDAVFGGRQLHIRDYF